MDKILAQTESVCPICLQRIPAKRVQRGEDVYLEKLCSEHGPFSAVIWRGEPAYTQWVRPKTPSYPEHPFTEVRQGCPFDCGLCPEHRQHSCCVLLEVTQRCNENGSFLFFLNHGTETRTIIVKESGTELLTGNEKKAGEEITLPPKDVAIFYSRRKEIC